MKNLALICLFLIVSLTSISQVDSSLELRPIEQAQQSEIEIWMDSIITAWMDSVTIPGLTISMVRGDSVIYKKGFGHFDTLKSKEIDPDSTVFRIASISKVFSATCALQMVHENKIDLDADVSQYLDFDIKRFRDSEISLHNLLTHTAGLDEQILGGGTKDRSLVPKLGEYMAHKFPPQIRNSGEAFSYSNLGYGLIGHLTELVSEKPLYELADDLLLKPLNMNSTAFMRSSATDSHEPTSYFLDDNLLREYPPFELRRYPSGGMLSTADDMSRLMIMMLNDGVYNGHQILDPAVLELLTKDSYTQDERLDGTRSYGFFNWNVNDTRFLNHGGSIEGFRSQYYLFPDQKVGIFISTNSSWGGLAMSNIIRELRKKWFYTQEEQAQPITSKGIPDRANEIRGVYYTTRSPQTSIMRIGRLTSGKLRIDIDEQGYLTLGGDTTARYAQSSPLEFTSTTDRTDIFNPISFKTDKNDDVKYFYLSGFNSYYKLKWWELDSVQLPYALIIFGLLIIGLLIQLILNLRKKNAVTSLSSSLRILSINWAAFLHVITFLTIGFYLYISDGLVFDYGLPWYLKLLLVLPIIALILTLFGLFRFGSIKKDETISRFQRLVLGVMLFALVLIIPFLYYWNLLGFHY